MATPLKTEFTTQKKLVTTQRGQAPPTEIDDWLKKVRIIFVIRVNRILKNVQNFYSRLKCSQEINKTNVKWGFFLSTLWFLDSASASMGVPQIMQGILPNCPSVFDIANIFLLPISMNLLSTNFSICLYISILSTIRIVWKHP